MGFLGIGKLWQRWGWYRKLSPALTAIENVWKAIRKEKWVMGDVKSSWASKINWVAVGGGITALVAAFGIEMSEELQKQILTAVPVVGGTIIWIMRTWFTKKLTKGSTSGGTG